MGLIRIKNKYNFTAEQIKGEQFKYEIVRKDGRTEVVLVGTFINADDDYLYLECGNNNKDTGFVIEFDDDISIDR